MAINDNISVYPSNYGGYYGGGYRRPAKKTITERYYDDLGRCIKEVVTEEIGSVWTNDTPYYYPWTTWTTNSTSYTGDLNGNDSEPTAI